MRSGEGEVRNLTSAPHFSCIYAEKVRDGAETLGVTGFRAIFRKTGAEKVRGKKVREKVRRCEGSAECQLACTLLA